MHLPRNYNQSLRHHQRHKWTAQSSTSFFSRMAKSGQNLESDDLWASSCACVPGNGDIFVSLISHLESHSSFFLPPFQPFYGHARIHFSITFNWMLMGGKFFSQPRGEKFCASMEAKYRQIFRTNARISPELGKSFKKLREKSGTSWKGETLESLFFANKQKDSNHANFRFYTPALAIFEKLFALMEKRKRAIVVREKKLWMKGSRPIFQDSEFSCTARENKCKCCRWEDKNKFIGEKIGTRKIYILRKILFLLLPKMNLLNRVAFFCFFRGTTSNRPICRRKICPSIVYGLWLYALFQGRLSLEAIYLFSSWQMFRHSKLL